MNKAPSEGASCDAPSDEFARPPFAPHTDGIMKHLTKAMLLGVALTSGHICAAEAAEVPRAVTVARTTEIPGCSLHVDAAVAGRGDGTAQRPHKTIAAAVAAA